MILEIRHLRLIDAIHREGTVSRAAERLFLTQSAASHALRDLEDKLDLKLFRRERRRMLATAEGHRLIRTAAAVLEEVRQAEKDLAHFKTGCHRILRIATQCYTCYSWLPAVLGTFGEEFPGVDVRIAPEATDDPVEALVTGQVEIAILHERALRDDIIESPLFHDELMAILPCGHPLGTREAVEPSDFADQHLILHGSLECSFVFNHFLKPAGIHPRKVSQLKLTEAVVEAVRSGLGITVVARWVVAAKLARGGLTAIRLGQGGLFRTWSAAMARHEAESAPVRELIRLIRQSAAPLRWEKQSGAIDVEACWTGS